MALIDIDKFVASVMHRWDDPLAQCLFYDMKVALEDQGLEYKDREIVKTQRRVSVEAKENRYSESEDEKIRKRLMAMCQHYIECYAFDQYNLVGYKEALAWLEKQKSEEINVKALLTADRLAAAEMTGRLKERKDIVDNPQKYGLEKQGASIDVDSILNKVGIKPAYKDGNAWCILYGDNIQDGVCGFGYTKEEALIEFLKDLLEKQGEQKPAWSEEDEQYLLVCKNALAKYQITDKWDASIISRWLETKLKSLRPQPKQEWKQENREELTEFENAMMHIGGSFFGENAGLDPNDTAVIKEQAELLLELAPKTEWSEEDESMLNDIMHNIHFAETNRNVTGSSAMEKEQVNWLKSLKQRYAWKPSKEQMTALSEASGIVGMFTPRGTNLQSLYNDLKKL